MPAAWPSSHRKALLIGLILVMLAIGTMLLFWGGPSYQAARSTKAFWDLGHVLYFFLAAYLLVGWNPVARLAAPWRWTLILGFTYLVGVLIEILQYGTQRSPDMGDVYRDLTGAVLLLSFEPGQRQIQARFIRTGLQSLAVMLLLLQIWPLTQALIDETIIRVQFPLLAGFETPFELSRWKGDAKITITAAPFPGTGKALRVSLSRRAYSGIKLKYFARNWQGYNSLSMRLFNPLAEPLWITCRIHDRAHETGEQRYDDRFNRRFLLEQGWNTLTIRLAEVASAPKTRQLNLAHTARLGIYTAALRKPRILYLDDVRLNR